MWTARLLQESRYHEESIFLTLTYDPEQLPTGGTLVKEHLTLFFKRLRRSLPNRKLRYYAVGEYGDTSLRPHYHVILFGYRPPDAELLYQDDSSLYTSAFLDERWRLGFTVFGEVTPATCAYTARYVTKKITGPPSQTHYERMSLSTGEITQVIPEFAVMSRNPGIARAHFEDYKHEIYPDDFVIVESRKVKTPRYYDRLLDKINPTLLESIKATRQQRAKLNKKDYTADRLAQREVIAKQRLSVRTRNLTRQ